jgi:hypothetical protein
VLLSHGTDPAAAIHSHHAADGLLVFAVHSAAMLIALATAAFVSFTLIGIGFLRRAWLNLDTLWIGALVLAAAATLFLG